MLTINKTLENTTTVVDYPALQQAFVSAIQPVGQLTIRTVYDVEQWIAQEDLTGMFGEGDSPQEAMADLVGSLNDLRLELTAHVGVLSPRLHEQLSALQAVFGP
jgi:hypothetical protein